MTQTRSVLVGKGDYARLSTLLTRSDPQSTRLLFDELDAATILPDAELPADVVVMGSVVSFRDTDSGEESTVELVYPPEADPARRRVSVLAPVGAALIGLRVGEHITWPVPNGRDRHLMVMSVRSSSHTAP